MTHQVPEYYRAVSELLSQILDNVGYSLEDRDRMVRNVFEGEVFLNIHCALNKYQHVHYIFGSRGEGSTGPGLQSDVDFLFYDEGFDVITDLTDCQPDKNIISWLMVKDTFTHPGYVKLQMIDISPDYTPVPRYHDEDIDIFITLDTLNRSVLSNTVIHDKGHISGPAWQNANNLGTYSTDTVYALRCSQWPREGHEWFQRRRFYGWPTPKQIENAWGYGCFATPVGHPHSSEQHLEWRLSFSIAERDLTRSFEGSVMKVYLLLKMIKKTYIEHVVGDAFSSYHCKVCMLWMRERTPPELWRNENLLYCLILCIKQLYEWAITGFCPDYFIITNNIYDRKIVGAKQFDLVQILRYLLSAECSFLLGIKCCYLGQLLANRISRFEIHHILSIPLICEEVHLEYISSISRAFDCRHAILNCIPQYYTTLVDYLERFISASRHLLQYPLRYAMMVLYSQLGFHIATVCKENACFLSSEQVDYLVALSSGCLSLGIKSDATSVRLKLCGLGMELGNFDQTEVCLQHISDYCMRYMYLASYSYHSTKMLKRNTWRAFTKRYRTEELLQTKVSLSVVYMPSESSITPTPLRMEMFRSIGTTSELSNKRESWYDWAVVDSLMCLCFFQYLNFIRHGKERQKQAALDNMIHVIRTKTHIVHRDTALNLLGYSFMQENQLTNAFVCFTQSLKIRPYHNAAKFYLGLLFKKTLVAK